MICKAPKIEYSAKSPLSLPKLKRVTTSNKASSKPKPAQEKESVHQDYFRDNEPKEKNNLRNTMLNVLLLLTIRKKNYQGYRRSKLLVI